MWCVEAIFYTRTWVQWCWGSLWLKTKEGGRMVWQVSLLYQIELCDLWKDTLKRSCSIPGRDEPFYWLSKWRVVGLKTIFIQQKWTQWDVFIHTVHIILMCILLWVCNKEKETIILRVKEGKGGDGGSVAERDWREEKERGKWCDSI